MKTFGTHGPVNREDHYVVSRAEELADFMKQLRVFLWGEKLVLIIDEFEGIPRDAARGFLHALLNIYVQRSLRGCPYSAGYVIPVLQEPLHNRHRAYRI